MTGKTWLWGAAAALSLLVAGQAWSARVSDVRGTKHNLSTSGTGSVKATSETQVCVFCHTPHAATSGAIPLWNRKLSISSYTPYSSNSLDATQIEGPLAAPGGSSKLCLSCHDGTMAIGNVNVLSGKANVDIAMTGTTGGKMPDGAGPNTGFTRNLGIVLSNDHPISVTYTTALAQRDGELSVVDANQKFPSGTGETIGVRTTGYKPKLPLEPTGSGTPKGQVQCATCHDPHIRESDASKGNQKFLRLNRFQEAQPSGTFNQTNDIICLACHEKGAIWAYSAHANRNVLPDTLKYTAAGAAQREFPADLPVWKAACLNCHDTHSVVGSRRLLREGTDSTATPKSSGNSAIEQTCFQCHTTSATSVITPLTTVPDIGTDYLPGNKNMPITGTEMHDIGGSFNNSGFVDCTGTTNKCGKDFIENRTLLGHGNNLANRHAECTDCHNPHRVVKFKDFRGNPLGTISGTPDASGTHRHTDTNDYLHTNIASGVLRGSWGVEPTYSSASFHAMPSGYTVKRGDPGVNTDIALSLTVTYVTREYQICLKCHSDYAYSDDNLYPSSNNRPQLGGGTKTAADANGHTYFTSYTNQAKEFQAPIAHAVPTGSVSLGTQAGNNPARAASNTNNHRSWHPVMARTGRFNRAGSWLAPWNNAGIGNKLGYQTMYCTDCHGSSTGTEASVIPTGGENGSPWGPHGSSINFLLKGDYSTGSGEGVGNTLCFKCHSEAAYSGATAGGTGWQIKELPGDGGDPLGDGHRLHSERVDFDLRCNWCHVAVPHGWKNRSLLVNLLDVGVEAGLAEGSAPAYTNLVGYTNGPYYRKAFLRIISFPAAGVAWTEAQCNGGSKATMKNNCERPL